MINLDEIISKIINERRRFNVVALHDFFIDHFIHMEISIEELMVEILNTAKRGGGNIFRNTQNFMRGGCAANFASAIAKLGVNVKLITCANSIGMEILKRDAIGVDLENVKLFDSQAVTTIIEGKYMGKQVNIMMSYPGMLSEFGMEKLDEKNWEAILNSDYICLFTWNVNKHGTELVERVAEKVKENGRGKVYLDLGDPKYRIEDLKELMHKIEKRNLIDALSLNENEIDIISKIILKDRYQIKNIKETIIKISEEIDFRLDVHTPEFSATARNGKIVIAPCFKVNVLRTTGAGDAWNAGNVLCWGSKMDDHIRLLIANAVAAIYISKDKPEHPDIHELKDFLKQNLDMILNYHNQTLKNSNIKHQKI
ncbi:MAG: carbohydrate kinase family protein [Candidatus Methanomethylicia archaeon]